MRSSCDGRRAAPAAEPAKAGHYELMPPSCKPTALHVGEALRASHFRVADSERRKHVLNSADGTKAASVPSDRIHAVVA